MRERVTFEPRLPTLVFERLLTWAISAFVRRRQWRLSVYFADNAPRR